MPTQSSTYNSRVTDEALEKRFRDTFKSQGGAELVDDLYAQGVIVPVVDFTAAATGEQLAQNLQTAWDFSTGHNQLDKSSGTVISNAGFWKVDLQGYFEQDGSGAAAAAIRVYISDGLSAKTIYQAGQMTAGSLTDTAVSAVQDEFVVFLRSGDSLVVVAASACNAIADVWYRQIATVNGDLINPTGFTSS